MRFNFKLNRPQFSQVPQACISPEHFGHLGRHLLNVVDTISSRTLLPVLETPLNLPMIWREDEAKARPQPA